jgi:hypothetical protein
LRLADSEAEVREHFLEPRVGIEVDGHVTTRPNSSPSTIEWQG